MAGWILRGERWFKDLDNNVQLRVFQGADEHHWTGQVWRGEMLLWEGRGWWDHKSAKGRAGLHGNRWAKYPKWCGEGPWEEPVEKQIALVLTGNLDACPHCVLEAAKALVGKKD